VRFQSRCYQLEQPIYPEERGGKVVIEVGLDGSMAIRFQGHYLKSPEIAPGGLALGAEPPRPCEV
jgi:hypothetical protein